MKPQKGFAPDANLDEKIERNTASKIISPLTSLIYDSLQTIRSTIHMNTYEHFYYHTFFDFNEGTEIFINYTNQPFFESEKGLARIEGHGLGLCDILIKSTIRSPIEVIEQTFSLNPLKYKSLPFQMTRAMLNKLIEKDDFLLKDVKQFQNSFVIDRMAYNYVEKGDCYKLTEGNFYSIVKSKDIIVHKEYNKKLKKFFGIKEKAFHTMSIYEVLPFTEKEKELLSNLEEFEISYRFPRPYEDADRESKHLFQFRMKKKDGKYEVYLNLNDGFTSGLNLESIWPAEKLFDYLNSEKKMVCCNERITKHDPKTDRYKTRSSGDKKFYERSLDPLSLYKEDAESFIVYFSSRSVEEKKVLIERMIDCDFVNEKVIAWMNEKETKIIQEVGFK